MRGVILMDLTKKQKECPYCNSEKPLNTTDNDDWLPDEIFIDGNNLIEDQYEQGPGIVNTINYCPMCGRKLEDN